MRPQKPPAPDPGSPHSTLVLSLRHGAHFLPLEQLIPPPWEPENIPEQPQLAPEASWPSLSQSLPCPWHTSLGKILESMPGAPCTKGYSIGLTCSPPTSISLTTFKWSSFFRMAISWYTRSRGSSCLAGPPWAAWDPLGGGRPVIRNESPACHRRLGLTTPLQPALSKNLARPWPWPQPTKHSPTTRPLLTLSLSTP